MTRPRPIVVVGLAPAAHGANRTGRMFTGDRSGEWLYRALWRAGFANRPESVHRDDGLVLDGRVHHRAGALRAAGQQADRSTSATGADRSSSASWPCSTRRGSTWCSASSATRCCAGVLGVRPRPKFGHGVEVRARAGPTGRARSICSYHVSQQNTFTGKLTEAMLDDVFRGRGPRRPVGDRSERRLRGPYGPRLRRPAHFGGNWVVGLIRLAGREADDGDMRPNVRRIDLTQTPTAVEILAVARLARAEGDDVRRVDAIGIATHVAVPRRSAHRRGRSGLWDAMARPCSGSVSPRWRSARDDRRPRPDRPGDRVRTVDAPHLAYLARVACSADGDDDRNHLPGADVIAHGRRSRPRRR